MIKFTVNFTVMQAGRESDNAVRIAGDSSQPGAGTLRRYFLPYRCLLVANVGMEYITLVTNYLLH